MILGILLLLTGLTISAVAIYYSVLGLAAIFAAATVPIYIMGSTLEVAKLVCASWLKANWERAPIYIKSYMVIAVVVLMAITSMGIFGFLSKAHTDQSIVSGDASAQLAIYDEKIRTAKDNIDANRKSLKQMDEAVDQVMARSTTETGAEKAVQIRKSQSKERSRLLQEIETEQKKIGKINEERAPIAAQNRKIEAEVGPIKYIAKLIYGDNPDTNLLEKAVTWVIILIVVVFDPLAVIMLLAAQMTFSWLREQKKAKDDSLKVSGDNIVVEPTVIAPAVETAEEITKPTVSEEEKEAIVTAFTESSIHLDTVTPPVVELEKVVETTDQFDIKKHPYLFDGGKFWNKPEGWKSVGPIVYKPEESTPPQEFVDNKFPSITVDSIEVKVDEVPVEELPKKKVHDQRTGSSESDNQEMTYIQNGEQNENSLWNRLRDKVSEEFKPTDYLTIVYSQGLFEDFQYDPESEPELDKFINDIKHGTGKIGDYSQEKLKQYASRIYELRKN